ncbi:MAG: phytanoyl-CoA dioxygenase family protein [Pseudomonadota bacterium]
MVGHFRLNQRQKDAYQTDGYLSPLTVFSAEEAASMRRELEQFEADYGEDAAAMRTDLHLLEAWAWRAVNDPRVIQPVCDLLGPNVLLWSTNWFIKEAKDGKFVSMHQDANYWGLYPYDVLTAWIALSDAGEATGPMRFVTGSHKGDLLDHTNTFDKKNLLTRGQEVNAQIDESHTVLAPLNPGQMSLHHVGLIHGSGPNTTNDRRIGMVLRFCGTHVRQTKGADTAVLVAGEDSYGHFELLPEPLQNRGDAEQARHLDAVQKMYKHVMSD